MTMFIPGNDSMKEILKGQNNFISNASNFAAYIFQTMKDINWIGFYILDGDEMLVGPFQGKPACVRLTLGKGVCGTAAQKKEILIVPDVENFPGHIACDADSKSEIVLPIIKDGILYGVLDIDSPLPARFSHEDANELSESLQILIESSDLEALSIYYQTSSE
ncbi:MAG: hypothetical protein HW421_3969 [Ignavibacteria bacterium]|nr:hypothetical protein [Ignavibacteria bacterium]